MHKFLSIWVVAVLLFSGVSCSKKDYSATREEGCENTILSTPEWVEFMSQDELPTQYYPIWKTRFMERNNMSEAFFDRHIEVFYVDTSYSEFNRAIALTVSYKYQSDWAIVLSGEQMTIRINDKNSPFYSPNIPVNTNLTREQIDQLISDNPATIPHYYYPVSQQTSLKFSSLEVAIDAFSKHLGLKKLCTIGFALTENGQFALRYGNQRVENGTTYCLDAELNLISGEIESREVICVSN